MAFFTKFDNDTLNIAIREYEEHLDALEYVNRQEEDLEYEITEEEISKSHFVPESELTQNLQIKPSEEKFLEVCADDREDDYENDNQHDDDNYDYDYDYDDHDYDDHDYDDRYDRYDSYDCYDRYDYYEQESDEDECLVGTGRGGGICPCCGGLTSPNGRNARRRAMFGGLQQLLQKKK